MRRRISEAIVGVSAVILVVLGLPLAIVVHRAILDSEVVELQATAARALGEVELPIDPAQLESIEKESDAPPPITIYDATGRRVFGPGPRVADETVQRALAGQPSSATEGEIEVATPITQPGTETVVGALRVTESLAGANHRARIAWLVMALAGLIALTVGALVANRLARRLSQPLTDLADAAATIGDGGAMERVEPSGIEELDSLATVLAGSVDRVNESLARERRFSADVSHQLRTPMTGLRLQLEAARDHGDPDAAAAALDDLDRLEATVAHLLAFARGTAGPTSAARLDEAAGRAAVRWADRAVASGRTFESAPSEPVSVQGSSGSIDQIVDVLVDNALRHGTGTVRIGVRRLSGGGAIDVADEGTGISPADARRIFERGHGSGTGSGIGLALARSLAEADGGRLVITRHRPTTFSLILLAPDLAVDPPGSPIPFPAPEG